MQPVKKLESLNPEMLEWLLDMTSHTRRLADVIKPLRERGVEVSVSTLTRFIRGASRESGLGGWGGDESRG